MIDNACFIGSTKFESFAEYNSSNSNNFESYKDIVSAYKSKWGYPLFDLFIKYLEVKHALFFARHIYHDKLERYIDTFTRYLLEEQMIDIEEQSTVDYCLSLESDFDETSLFDSEYKTFVERIKCNYGLKMPELGEKQDYDFENKKNIQMQHEGNITIANFLEYMDSKKDSYTKFSIQHLHRVKGLEFEKVILKTDRIPYYQYKEFVQYLIGDDQSKGQIEKDVLYTCIEELNKLYVMMTRSKSDVEIINNPKSIFYENNWKKVKLGEVTECLDSKRVPLNSEERGAKKDGKLYPYYGANGVVDNINEYIFDEEILCVAEDGGSWGKGQTCSYIVNHKCWVNNHAHVLTAREGLDLRYLKYYLNHSDLNSFIAGTTRGKLNRTNLDRIEIPLPPLPIQKKIADVLDKADEIRRKRQKAINKLDKLVQSVFLDMFGDPVRNEKGWKVKKLGDICNIRSSRRIFKSELKDSGVPFYRGQEVKELSYGNRVKNELYISEKRYEEILSEDYGPKKGDLLLPSITPDGEIWIVDTDEPFYFKDGRVLWIENDHINISSFYLKFFLKSLFKSDYNKIASGTTFKELKIFILKSIDILIPNKKVQNDFEAIVERITNNIEKTDRLSEETDNLFNSLMQKAFRGELQFIE